MPRLDDYQRGHLSKLLNGMQGGRTLTEDRLTVRGDTMEYSFVLVEVYDSYRIRCHCCGDELPGGARHWGESILRVQGLPDCVNRVPLCSDCAVPK